MSRKIWWPPAEIDAGHRIDEPSNGIEQRSISTQLNYPEFPDSSKCPHPLFERGLCVDGKQPCLRCDAMVEVGKVYEYPQNAPKSPYSHDLPKDGAMVQDVNKEAVASSRSEFERAFQNSLTYQHLEQANYFQKAIFAFNDATGKYIHYVVQAAYEMWQHQQAVVTTLTEALDIKEQLNQKLREREEELQKRVGELEKENLDLRVEIAKRALSTFTAPKPAKVGWFACFNKALGADHESN